MTGSTVSVLVFTLDEEVNLPTCLDSLDWCDDVVVIDSFSTDRTLAICRRRGIRVVQHPFTGFGDQRNFALENVDLRHDWVLILDADERTTPDLVTEISGLAAANDAGVGAYRVRRRFYLWGRWLRYSSLYPTWVVRFVHRERVRYVNRGHAETEEVAGETRQLQGHLIDENLKGLEAWFERQSRYALKEAEFELEREGAAVDWRVMFSSDPMARRALTKRLAANLPFRGAFYFLYCYLFRMGFLDGRDGLVFCRMKAMYQNMIVMRKHEIRKSADDSLAEKVDTRT